jgi:hypothetical protein
VVSFRAILEVLSKRDVDFIVVGGVAGVLHGSPLQTADLDIVYSLDVANQARLLVALEELDAIFRDDPRNLRPNLSHLACRGHKLLSTRFGDFDCLATIEENTTYDDLVEHTEVIQIGELRIKLLSLQRLISVKEKLQRPKDRLALMHLRATQEERNAREKRQKK